MGREEKARHGFQGQVKSSDISLRKMNRHWKISNSVFVVDGEQPWML